MRKFAPIAVALMLFNLAGSAMAASSPADNMFGSLYGKWRGKGVIILQVGKPEEKLSCRVTYTPVSDTLVDANIRCAAVDFKIDAKGKISYSKHSKMFRGNLSDKETGWTLVLSAGQPKKQYIRFGLKIAKAEVNGWLDLKIKSRKSHTWLALRTTSTGLKTLLRIDFRR
ncbi:MAG: hypothetical protein COB78_00125 [Hyphomicrobiales bacterium]|nr:MAG: hypothetical protein COB78_00125 [Hyphomicrobiales bacterium]